MTHTLSYFQFKTKRIYISLEEIVKSFLAQAKEECCGMGGRPVSLCQNMSGAPSFWGMERNTGRAARLAPVTVTAKTQLSVVTQYINIIT